MLPVHTVAVVLANLCLQSGRLEPPISASNRDGVCSGEISASATPATVSSGEFDRRGCPVRASNRRQDSKQNRNDWRPTSQGSGIPSEGGRFHGLYLLLIPCAASRSMYRRRRPAAPGHRRCQGVTVASTTTRTRSAPPPQAGLRGARRRARRQGPGERTRRAQTRTRSAGAAPARVGAEPF